MIKPQDIKTYYDPPIGGSVSLQFDTYVIPNSHYNF